MYNILTELKMNIGICLVCLFFFFFFKAGKEGSRALERCPQKCIIIVGMEEEGISKLG